MNKVFLNLGKQPLANSFLSNIKKITLKNEFFYNLKICFNTKNCLVSIKKPVNPKKQYTNKYAHRASESKTMREAFKNTARRLFKRFKPKQIMEIGSNDGVFLKNFDKKKVIAVEPCKNLAQLTKKMFKTYPDFWNLKLSKKIISKEKKKIDLIFSANTISHIPNLRETFVGINKILSENGVLVIEDPSNDLADNSQYWLAECYYSTKNYKRAILEFEKVFTFPGTDKDDDSQLKLALSYQSLGNLVKAREEYQRMVDYFPSSEYFSRAKESLKQLSLE